MTMTRPTGFGGAAGSVAQPAMIAGVAAAAAPAPIALMNSRRVYSFLMVASSLRLLRRPIGGHRLDLLFGQPFGDLVHDRRRPRSGAEVAQVTGERLLRLTGEVRHTAGVHAGRAVADRAARREVAAGVR